MLEYSRQICGKCLAHKIELYRIAARHILFISFDERGFFDIGNHKQSLNSG